MTGEKINPLPIFHKMIKFGNLLPNQGVRNFVVEGPTRKLNRIPFIMCGLFPNPSRASDKDAVMIAIREPETRELSIKYWSRIKRLVLPERVARLKDAPDVAEVRDFLTKISKKNGWPIIMLTFNHYQYSGEEFIFLQCIAGISPQTALRELQEKAEERLAKFQ